MSEKVDTMIDAPERIWAFWTPDDFDDSATITAYETVQHGGREYIRADLSTFEAGIEAAAETAERLQKQVDNINEEYQEKKLPGVCLSPDGFDIAEAIRALTPSAPAPVTVQNVKPLAENHRKITTGELRHHFGESIPMEIARILASRTYTDSLSKRRAINFALAEQEED